MRKETNAGGSRCKFRSYRAVHVLVVLLTLVSNLCLANTLTGGPKAQARVEVVLSNTANGRSISGRLLLMLSKTNSPEVRLAATSMFGIDVHALTAGDIAVFDRTVRGFPWHSIADVPAGDYYIQALMNVYTEFHRADGHVIWAHMDQWEGQRASISPGNLYSKVQKIHIDRAHHLHVKLALTEVVAPLAQPSDSAWVKHIKIQSKLLSDFWGRPIYLGAIVVLPRDYAQRSDTRYPVIYVQEHFSDKAPFGFSTEEIPETPAERDFRIGRGLESGYEFYQAWRTAGFPRVILVKLLHPTPYYDDSYSVNSANNGPYGDAIMNELIPYVETEFRTIHSAYARIVTGGSTGGWESLALQLYHPDFFGGAWIFYPDPIDFRRYGLLNIYEEDNAFRYQPKLGAAGEQFLERPFWRSEEGRPIQTMRQLSEVEAVLGTNGRSGSQLDAWDAVYGPVGDEGYPQPLWDSATGNLDKSVATYMREHDYDLRDYAQRHWAQIGPQLSGKLHFYCGDMDNAYLNLGVYLFEDFLKTTDEASDSATFEYGRPLKGHGWHPMQNAELIRRIARQISAQTPTGAAREWEKN